MLALFIGGKKHGMIEIFENQPYMAPTINDVGKRFVYDFKMELFLFGHKTKIFLWNNPCINDPLNNERCPVLKANLLDLIVKDDLEERICEAAQRIESKDRCVF